MNSRILNYIGISFLPKPFRFKKLKIRNNQTTSAKESENDYLDKEGTQIEGSPSDKPARNNSDINDEQREGNISDTPTGNNSDINAKKRGTQNKSKENNGPEICFVVLRSNDIGDNSNELICEVRELLNYFDFQRKYDEVFIFSHDKKVVEVQTTPQEELVMYPINYVETFRHILLAGLGYIEKTKKIDEHKPYHVILLLAFSEYSKYFTDEREKDYLNLFIKKIIKTAGPKNISILTSNSSITSDVQSLFYGLLDEGEVRVAEHANNITWPDSLNEGGI